MLTIKSKLAMLGAIILAGILGFVGFQYYSIGQLDQLRQTENSLTRLDGKKQQIRGYAKDFVLYSKPESVAQFNQAFAEGGESAKTLLGQLESLDIDATSLKNLVAHMERYRELFLESVELRKEIGLTPTDGLRGSLRASIHAFEEAIDRYSSQQLIDMLQLRRAEKDFFLRMDLSYRDKWLAQYDETLANLGASMTLTPQQRSNLEARLEAYRKDFLAVTEAYELLGLAPDQGITKEIIASVLATDTNFAEMDRLIKQALQQRTATLNTIMVIAAILFILVALVPTFLIGRSIVVPIKALAKTMQQAQENRDLTLRYSHERKDEVGQMATDFNQMMDAFQSVIDRVAGTSTQLAAAAEELSATTKDTTRGLNTQQAEVMQVAAAIQEMESAMQEIAGNTERTAATAQDSLDGAVDSSHRVSLNMEGLHKMAQKARDTANVVSQLRSDSDEIGTMLDVIKDIAEQTNLLALNASIEAARAGEQGRGFSVVADEVRNLASRSQQSAEQIAKLVIQLQTRTRDVEVLMQESVEESEQGAASANETIDALTTITEGARSIVDMTTQVASATEEQASVAAEVTRNVEVISSIIEQAVHQTEQNADASHSVSQQAHGLEDLMSRFKH
ncbi:methyl-accepting chemotaxis protein [Marinobacterium mangrovicola]|uniref:Methyl-accepting chemotaxis protein n=1 Tax=Marinobacterium mangrovicola TaxID=1476959 RepID=A0A4R1H5X2_9GAMM|nr:methyl-accepting chemotaxis protein [Marinobacterium mangrovicola]TCK16508.1 methyl-accepting chemotaxis protein [Marinobacterium mangrovicola]